MNFIELKKGLELLDFRVAYSQFNKQVATPFLCYLDKNNEDLVADNKHYFVVGDGVLELYTDYKDQEAEFKVEGFLNENEIPYKKMGTVYIEKENLYETIYNINLF